MSRFCYSTGKKSLHRLNEPKRRGMMCGAVKLVLDDNQVFLIPLVLCPLGEKYLERVGLRAALIFL